MYRILCGDCGAELGEFEGYREAMDEADACDDCGSPHTYVADGESDEPVI